MIEENEIVYALGVAKRRIKAGQYEGALVTLESLELAIRGKLPK